MRAAARAPSAPLAGTVARSGDPEEDRRLALGLLASPKERAEHAVVVASIVEGLAPSHDLDVPASPHLLELRNVIHLAPTIEAAPRPKEGRLPRARAELHTDPGGRRRPTARRPSSTSRSNEASAATGRRPGRLDRRLGRRGVVARRSARRSVEGGARLFAGVGIVEGSEPAAELAETQLKLQALLAAAVRP